MTDQPEKKGSPGSQGQGQQDDVGYHYQVDHRSQGVKADRFDPLALGDAGDAACQAAARAGKFVQVFEPADVDAQSVHGQENRKEQADQGKHLDQGAEEDFHKSSVSSTPFFRHWWKVPGLAAKQENSGPEKRTTRFSLTDTPPPGFPAESFQVVRTKHHDLSVAGKIPSQ